MEQPSMTEQTLQLKVLTGRNTGALLPLEIGEYLIGSGDTCAIILQDHGVQDEHCLLEIEADGVRILPQDGEVLVNGEQVAEGGAPFHLYQAVFIGETAFALGMGEDEWPDIELSPQTDQDETEEPPEQGSSEQDGQEPEQADAPDSEQAQPLSAKSPFRVWGLALLLILLIAVLLMRAFLNFEPPEPAAPPESLAQEVSTIIEKKEITGLQVNSEDNVLTVSGYVADQKTRKDISAAILAAVPGTVIKLTVTENLQNSVRQILTIYDLQDLSATVNLQGQVFLQGTVRDSSTIKKAVAAIEQDVPGISGIINQTTLLRKTVVTPERKFSFPINEVAGVVVGKTSFISMRNGVIYKTGSQAVGGCSILSISRNVLSVSCAGTEKKYPLLP
jgi:hypothetical protein